MRYGVPRHLDLPEQLVPFFTVPQAVSLGAGVAVSLLVWLGPLAPLVPDGLRWWVVVYAPLVGFLATRRVALPRYRGGWTWLQLARAWARYAARPRRTVWKGGER